MKLIADYHTHTRYSHGIGTIEENVISAMQKGLQCIAITEHGPAYSPYGIKLGDYKYMRETVKVLQEKYSDKIKILLGMEANIIDEQGTLDVDDRILHDCDILLVGFHFDIVHAAQLQKIRLVLHRQQSIKSQLADNLYQEIVDRNTAAMVHSLQKYPIDIITHPGDKQPIDIEKIADIAAKKKTELEINNFHRRLSVVQLKKVKENPDVRFVVSSDAHRPQDIGKFTGALKIILQSDMDIGRIQNIQISD
jgi:putative hydrolase